MQHYSQKMHEQNLSLLQGRSLYTEPLLKDRTSGPLVKIKKVEMTAKAKRIFRQKLKADRITAIRNKLITMAIAICAAAIGFYLLFTTHF